MPRIAVTLMVIFGFIGCALKLRLLAATKAIMRPSARHSTGGRQ
ncbi:hypothetical protein ACIRRA_12840 [Nocardia sp. NPDC101769]